MTSSVAWMMMGLLTGGIAVAGGLSFSTFNDGQANSAPPPLLTRVGDEIYLHVAFHDTEGRMLLSTRATDRPQLEAVKASYPGFFVLPWSLNDTPQRHVLDGGHTPLPLGTGVVLPILGQDLLGKPEGSVLTAPLIGKMQGYNQTIVLERTRGPFNRTISIGTDTLHKLAGDATTDHFALDSLFEATVVERREKVSRIRIDVQEGQVIQMRRTGFTATVALDETGERFYLRLDAEEGQRFALVENCQFARYVLLPGSYLVTNVDEEAITLSSSPTKWPQLIDRDLVAVLEISEIHRPGLT